MSVQVIVALIGLAGSAIGTLGGILVTNRLTAYRIDRLEKKVDLHNNLIERTYRLEEKQSAAECRIAALERRGGI